jgi:tRNA threonylcarbamoyladenosine biosynthesis protein TsaE
VRSWRSSSAAETAAIGRALAGELAPDGLLLLRGGLGAGKTVLVQGVAAGLGLDPREVQSPTFTLVREYAVPALGKETTAGAGARRLIHVDLYRLEPHEVEAAGIEELLAGPGVKAVEWSERLPFAPEGAMELEIERSGELRTIRELTPAPAPSGRR